MFRITVLFVFIGFACCHKHNHKYREINPEKEHLSSQFNYIANLAKKNLQCLEKGGNPSGNSTTQMALALKYFSVVHTTVPKLKTKEKNVLDAIAKRMGAFIDKGKQANADHPYRALWNSNYEKVPGNRFGAKHVEDKEGPWESKTYQTLLDQTFEVLPEYLDCLGQVFVGNQPSNNPQTCQLFCEPEIFDQDGPYTCSQRAYYCRVVQQLNCSNMQAIRDEMHCSCVLRDVETMLLEQNDDIFDAARNFFNLRVTSCAGVSFEEFLSEDIMNAVLKAIDKNGCVGAKFGDESMQVLTTQTLSILGMKLRHILEQIKNIC